MVLEEVEMFSSLQKRDVANKIQSILRETNHSELPTGYYFVRGRKKRLTTSA